MNLDFFQISFLAVLQGATEFLPISSSGHLILPSLLFSWEDQGLTFDVAVHIGTLLAVVFYFRHDLLNLTTAAFKSIATANNTEDSKLALMLIVATIPAGIAGLLFSAYIEQYARSLPVIGISSIAFGLLLFCSDRVGNKRRNLSSIDWKTAFLIGFAQILAIIPGTSRSGITITAALFCNLERVAAVRFSFLLSIPIIFSTGILKGGELVREGAETLEWLLLLYAVLLSALVAYYCIHYFLHLIERIGFLPFVIYRVLLGIALILIAL